MRMKLTELEEDQLAIICYVDTQEHNIKDLFAVMKLGVVGGLEIRKVSSTSSCAEYRIEGCSPKIAVSNDLADYIIVETLDETL